MQQVEGDVGAFEHALQHRDGAQHLPDLGGPRWFVLAAEWQQEAELAKAAAKKGAQVFMPVERREVRHARRVMLKSYPLISGYVFVQVDLVKDPWQEIGRLKGSTGYLGLHLVGDMLVPTAVRKGIMDRWISDMVANALAEPEKTDFLPELRPGTRALIHCGILADYTGYVVKDERGRTTVQLDKIFGGRDVEVARESVRGA